MNVKPQEVMIADEQHGQGGDRPFGAQGEPTGEEGEQDEKQPGQGQTRETDEPPFGRIEIRRHAGDEKKYRHHHVEEEEKPGGEPAQVEGHDRDLQVFLDQRMDAPLLHGGHQRRVITLGLVRIGQCKLTHSDIEDIRFSQVAADRCRIPRPRVGAGQCHTADLRIAH